MSVVASLRPSWAGQSLGNWSALSAIRVAPGSERTPRVCSESGSRRRILYHFLSPVCRPAALGDDPWGPSSFPSLRTRTQKSESLLVLARSPQRRKCRVYGVATTAAGSKRAVSSHAILYLIYQIPRTAFQTRQYGWSSERKLLALNGQWPWRTPAIIGIS